MYILPVYKRELSKNEYLKTLLITITKSLKKIIKKIKNYRKTISPTRPGRKEFFFLKS